MNFATNLRISLALNICHSQGAIHTFNALAQLPEEIRKRIIVLAIAPAKIIPNALCYKSYNYASENDLVPLAELAHANTFGYYDEELGDVNWVLENHKELILLPPRPGETGMGHRFNDPIFLQIIKDRINNHTIMNGNYK